jgi:hypothetical protein
MNMLLVLYKLLCLPVIHASCLIALLLSLGQSWVIVEIQMHPVLCFSQRKWLQCFLTRIVVMGLMRKRSSVYLSIYLSINYLSIYLIHLLTYSITHTYFVYMSILAYNMYVYTYWEFISQFLFVYFWYQEWLLNFVKGACVSMELFIFP